MREDPALEGNGRADVLWPDVPRVSIGTGEGASLKARLSSSGSREGGTRSCILGYLRAAETLFEHSTTHSKLDPRHLVFPLAYLWQHYVELSLKEIVALGRLLNQQSSDDTTPPRRLGDLLHVAIPYIVEHCSLDTPEMSNVLASIEELERIANYATRVEDLIACGQNSAGLSEPPFLVNLEVFQEEMLALSNFFDAIHTCQSLALDCAT